MPRNAVINKIQFVSPGRICLFGDHQDYLGLPVIACAINKQLVLTAKETPENVFHLLMPDIASERRISISETFETLEPNDHFASALIVLRNYGCIPNRGFTIELNSNLPINAGVSSSSATIVAWIHFLLVAFGCDHEVTSQLIAQIAYEAEVIQYNSPGGRMDQYTIALGNIIYIDTAQKSAYKTIGTSMDGLILAESGVAKDTLGLLSHIRTNATEAIEYVKQHFSEFELKEAKMTEYEMYSESMPENLKPYFYAAIKNHSITRKATALFEENTYDMAEMGKLMNAHHDVLKSLLKITVPKIDGMIDAAIEAGAYGAKIVGSGGGGSIVALAPKNQKEMIIKALLKNGAKDAYEVSVTRGSYIV